MRATTRKQKMKNRGGGLNNIRRIKLILLYLCSGKSVLVGMGWLNYRRKSMLVEMGEKTK